MVCGPDSAGRSPPSTALVGASRTCGSIADQPYLTGHTDSQLHGSRILDYDRPSPGNRLARCQCIIKLGAAPRYRFEMIVLEHSRARVSFASRCWIAVILLSVFALIASLATRFTVLSTEVQKVTRVIVVKSHPSSAFRQHLLSDGLVWTGPPSGVTLYQPPRSAVLMVSEIVPSTTLGSASWHHNRPPPSC
jgi:hypothetical protein